MPQLPSGRYIGIHCLGGAEIIRKYSDTHPEASLLTLGIEIAEMDSIEELPSYISILFLRESNSPTDMSLDSRSQSIPTDAEPYASGFTLADQSIFTADWPEEDKRAFAEFLQSERVVRYFEDNLKQVIRAGKWYQENLQAMMDEVCGDDTGDILPEWDDYDLIVALRIFADMAKPEEARQIDLWHRMNAMHRHWEEGFPGLASIDMKTGKSLQNLSGKLRDQLALAGCADDTRKWLHRQNVVFANDLSDIYEPEALGGINREAYVIVKSVALSEPVR